MTKTGVVVKVKQINGNFFNCLIEPGYHAGMFNFRELSDE